MPTVYLPAQFKERIEQLAATNYPDARGRPVFSTNMHLMEFAAMVGRASNRNVSELSEFAKGNEINEGVFVNNHKDGVAYLLALHEAKTGDILRDKNENECWKVIEKYAYLGLMEIDQWLLDRPADSHGVDTILAKMKEAAELLVENGDSQGNLDDVEF